MDENINLNKDLHFKGQYKNEHVITFFRRHWITLLPEIIMVVLFIFVIIFLAIMFGPIAYNPTFKPFFLAAIVIGVPLATYFMHIVFLEFIKHFMQMVIITNYRIVEVKKTIFIKDNEDTLFLENIQDVKKQQNGLWKNIFGFGELVIVMSSSDLKTISFVPNPNYHFRLISRIKQEFNQQHRMEPQQNRVDFSKNIRENDVL